MPDQDSIYPKLGLALFIVGTILFFIVGSQGTALLGMVLQISFLWTIGWGLIFITAVRKSPSILPLLIVLILFAFANFYLLADHFLHNASGLGFGMVHNPPSGHVMLGFIILVISTVLSSSIAFRKPKAK